MRYEKTGILMIMLMISGCTHSYVTVRGDGQLALWAARWATDIHTNAICQKGMHVNYRSAHISNRDSNTNVEVEQQCSR